jgi:hypothetical protein
VTSSRKASKRQRSSGDAGRSELASLTRNLDEVWSWTEDRLHGALDGVRVGGASTLDLAKDALATDEIDKIAVSTAVLGSSHEPGAVDVMTTMLRDAKGASWTR